MWVRNTLVSIQQNTTILLLTTHGCFSYIKRFVISIKVCFCCVQKLDNVHFDRSKMLNFQLSDDFSVFK